MLGYNIYQQQTGSQTTYQNSNQTVNRSIPQNTGNATSKGTNSQPRVLTADEQAVLKFPESSATEDEKNRWGQTVNKLAKAADVLEINNCVPTPLVVLYTIGSQQKVKNTGSSDLTILGLGTDYKVTAGSTVLINISSKQGAGNYGYSCSHTGGPQIPPISGIFLVHP